MSIAWSFLHGDWSRYLIECNNERKSSVSGRHQPTTNTCTDNKKSLIFLERNGGKYVISTFLRLGRGMYKAKDKLMRLWSYQSPDFSLVEGNVDPDKSQYAQKYKAAYQQLWGIVGDQIVWCCTSSDDWYQKSGFCEWVLEVPEDRFYRIVDEMVWAGIRRESCCPQRLRSQLLAKAIEKYPNSVDAYAWLDRQVKRLVHPPGDPWGSLFLNDPNDFRASILLRHPVERDWVKSVSVYPTAI